MKKFAALLLALTVACSFAACGGDENEGTASGTENSTTEKTTTAADEVFDDEGNDIEVDIGDLLGQ